VVEPAHSRPELRHMDARAARRELGAAVDRQVER